MKPSKRFQDLIVWQKSHLFVLNVYKMTRLFPRDEIYGLTAQFRRASISIAANIAEGFTKRTIPDKLRMLNISQGSLEECRYYIILAQDLDYGNDETLDILAEEVSKLLTAYMSALARSK